MKSSDAWPEEGYSRKYKRISKDAVLMKGLAEFLFFIQREETTLDVLRSKGRYEYERLKYGFSGYTSLRIVHDRKERLICREVDGGLVLSLIEISDHYKVKR